MWKARDGRPPLAITPASSLEYAGDSPNRSRYVDSASSAEA
jgi:hypothetical protein